MTGRLFAKRIDDLGCGTYRVLVTNENGTYQDPVQSQKNTMAQKLRGLGYEQAAEDFETHVKGVK